MCIKIKIKKNTNNNPKNKALVKKKVLENGDIYEGELKDGVMSGKGKYTFKSGSYYVGEFNNDAPNGKGVYYFLKNDQNKGDRYEGDYYLIGDF